MNEANLPGADASSAHASSDDEDEPPGRPPARTAPPSWRGYVGAVSVVSACTLVAWGMSRTIDVSNLAMVYLLGVTVTAMAFGRGPAILASILGVAGFDFFFVPPYFQFGVSDTQYAITFGVMLVVAVVIGTLTARLREQAQSAGARERRTAAVYQLSRELSARRTAPSLFQAARARIHDVFGARAAFLTPDEHGRLAFAGGDSELLDEGDHERGVAQWAFDNLQPAGLGTTTLSDSRALHLPLIASGEAIGILAVRPAEPARFAEPDRGRLLQTFANLTAVALERALFAARAERAQVEAQSERARNALLSSVSHDLRTPLAVITGAATGLRDSGEAMSVETRRELADTIADEGQRLNRLVGELLDMTRLESGALVPRRDWLSVEEVVGGVLVRLERSEPNGRVNLHVEPGLPLVALDEVLFGQAVHNLVENAVQHSPAGQAVDVSARRKDEAIELEVADRGPGLSPVEVTRVFEKFYRGESRRERRGAGLGLTIARGIIEAHGGTLTAGSRSGGGAVFRLHLPLRGEAPDVDRGPDTEAMERS